MRWIFTYNEAIKKHIEKVLKTKIKVEPQPWLHIAVKTVSKRNPWAGFVIYVWDTREVQKGGEYRSKTGKFETSNFTGVPGLRRAKDNRQPLKGGKGDINKFFEFEKPAGQECDNVVGTEGIQVKSADINNAKQSFNVVVIKLKTGRHLAYLYPSVSPDMSDNSIESDRIVGFDNALKQYLKYCKQYGIKLNKSDIKLVNKYAGSEMLSIIPGIEVHTKWKEDSDPADLVPTKKEIESAVRKAAKEVATAKPDDFKDAKQLCSELDSRAFGYLQDIVSENDYGAPRAQIAADFRSEYDDTWEDLVESAAKRIWKKLTGKSVGRESIISFGPGNKS